jgi:hypothetical protein
MTIETELHRIWTQGAANRIDEMQVARAALDELSRRRMLIQQYATALDETVEALGGSIEIKGVE